MGSPATARLRPGLPVLLAIASIAPACISFADPSWDRRHADYGTDSGDDGDADGDDGWTDVLECLHFCDRLAYGCPSEYASSDCRARCETFSPEERTCRGLYADSGRSLDEPLRTEVCGLATGSGPCVPACDLYCDAVGVSCRESLALFASRSDCLAACEDWSGSGLPWCAIDRARRAAAAPEVECRRASQDSCFCGSRGRADTCVTDGDDCDTPLDTLDHCGDCVTACAGGEFCDAALDPPTCIPHCPAGPLCDGVCIDAANDPARCGASDCTDGRVCTDDRRCDGTGACARNCADGLIDCGPCIDPDTDDRHCGGCDHSCGPREACRGGACTCLPPFGDCNGLPEDGCEAPLSDDPDHCGACGAACADGERCVAGRCVPGILALAAGRHHTCALRDGAVRCWGGGDCSGCRGVGGCSLLGTGDTGPSSRPVRVEGLDGAVALVAGALHTCALREDGTAACWGCGDLGALGTGGTDSSPRPVDAALAGIARLAAGEFRTCAIVPGLGVHCAGSRIRSGGLIYGGAATPVPVAFPSPDSIAAGEDLACSISAADRFVRCSGGNEGGRLAVGSSVDEFTSVERVLALRDPLEVAVGDRFGCARPPDGSVRCWGASERGQAGPGPAVASVPRPVPLPRPVVAVFAGFRTACAITDDRRLLCWGELLGASRPDPVGVPLPGDPVTVAVGNTHLCAGLADGRIFCLGSNDRGQLGDGTTIDSLAPVEAVFE